MNETSFFDNEVEKYEGDGNFMFYAIMTILITGAVIALAGIIRDKHFQKLDAQGCALEVVVCKGE